jgi:hypothetical protein
MNGAFLRFGLAVAVALTCIGLAAASASAAGSYEFDQTLSLRGDCGTGSPDLIPDPSCPEETPSGRFNEPRSIAIDAYGDEYVASYHENGAEGRIDVFDDEGHFITELLDPHGPLSVAVDTKGNLYVYDNGLAGEIEVAVYAPTEYEPAAGKIKYGSREVFVEKTSTEGGPLGGLAVDFSNDHLYVAYTKGFIEEFSSAAEGHKLLHTIPLPSPLPGAASATFWNNWVAVDSQRRRLFASYCKGNFGFNDCGVLVLEADPPYALVEELDGSNLPTGKFSSLKGSTSIAVDESSGHFFVADLEEPPKAIYEFDQNFDYFATTTFSKLEAPNSSQIAFSNSPLNPTAKNLGYLFAPFPKPAGAAFAFSPPGVIAAEVKSVSATNISETEAELHATIKPNGAPAEYVFEYVTEEEFAAEGFTNAQLAGTGTTSVEETVTVTATARGLIPGTSYRFRVVAENEVPPKDELEGSFRTFSDASIGGGCGNELLRTKFSALLPDCRAYELVTPADTNGRSPKGVGFGGDRFPTVEASPSGNTVAFVTEGGSLPGTEGTGGFNGDLYRTSRGPAGWGNVTRMGPTGTETNNPSPGSTSPDEEYGLFWAGGEGSAVIGGLTHWVRYPDGRAELVGRGSEGTDPAAEANLITEGGTHIVFKSTSPSGPLEEESPPSGTAAIYDRTSDEVTHVVSLLPGNIPAKAKEDALYLDASADGAGIAFSIGDKLYLRLHNEVTYEIGENVTLADVSEGGSRVFYLKGGDLFAFDTETEGATQFTEVGNATVVNVAPDGSRVYFLSTTEITGTGGSPLENPNHATPVAGQQNLYLSEEGQIRFVGTVAAGDVSGPLGGLGRWVAVQAGRAAEDPSRVTPDGSVLLFESRANLAGYNPEGSPEVYRYDSAGNRLDCISCPPTEAPAGEGASLETFALAQTTPPPFTAYGFVPNLRSDGKRVFFQSHEALVSRDSNNAQDVYEWEEDGVGSCTRSGGCVYLISSGHSARDNYLYSVSSSGDDVFFITEDVLVGGDNDTPSIYDARVGGGFPEPAENVCEGEGCHLPITRPPSLTSPGTPAPGTDNVKPSHRCPKGKRKVKRHGKVRCVRKHRHHRKASTRKGAGR